MKGVGEKNKYKAKPPSKIHKTIYFNVIELNKLMFGAL